MKDIRIFVASSKELIAERNQLAFLVLSMEEEFAARGLRVRLVREEVDYDILLPMKQFVKQIPHGGETEGRVSFRRFDFHVSA